MIKTLYQNIEAGLKTVRPCPVYQEDVPADTQRPYFLISISALKSLTGLNGRLRHKISIDISYVSNELEDKKSDCWSVGQELTRTFLAAGFKIKNRNVTMVEQVLHFTFDTEYREYPDPDIAKMQTMLQSMNMKED